MVFAPLPANVTDPPAQIVWSAPALTNGNAFTVTASEALKLSHPFIVWLTE